MNIVIRDFKEALSFLYDNLPMFQRQGAPAMKKDLCNIIALCKHLGNPQDSTKFIHVAGTNGKGSVSHMLSAMLQSHGFQVGVYTSPHYKDFRERIKINTKLVTRRWVVDFLNKHIEIIGEIKPSFFEISVAMAFAYFAEKKVDYAIIEVGLGGRLDSTNIITPLLSVITNISKDHVQFLGESLPEIATEKAGIIKVGVPVVIGEEQAKTIDVFKEIAHQRNAPLSIASQAVRVENKDSKVSVNSEKNELHFEALWFTDYQVKNLITAIKAYEMFLEIEELAIDVESIQDYLENMPARTYFLGRWMILGLEPKILTDSAHNEAGLKILLRKLNNLTYKKLHCVLGFSNDKDLSKVLPLFPKNARYYFAKANIPRGLEAEKLHYEALNYGLKGKKYVSVKNALLAAKRAAKKEDLIYIGGSIFVVAEVI